MIRFYIDKCVYTRIYTYNCIYCISVALMYICDCVSLVVLKRFICQKIWRQSRKILCAEIANGQLFAAAPFCVVFFLLFSCVNKGRRKMQITMSEKRDKGGNISWPQRTSESLLNLKNSIWEISQESNRPSSMVNSSKFIYIQGHKQFYNFINSYMSFRVD